jgi:signal transduction histidine kinase
MLRLRPRTVRGRATAAVTAVTAVCLLLCISALQFVMHRELEATARVTTEGQLNALTYQLRGESLKDLGTVISERNGTKVVDATALFAYAHPSDASAPATADREGMVGVNVATAEGSYLLEAEADLSSARATASTMRWLLILGLVLVVMLVAGLTWFAMGRALRPVEAIRGEFAEITAHDLHRRVPDPHSGDEVSRLAGTMNVTLNQLERAVLRLRTFTADASHELRSPLTTLRIRLELATARPEDADWPDTGRECLRDTEQLHMIVEDLLLLSRLDAGQIHGQESIVVADLVQQVCAARVGERQVLLDAERSDAVVAGSRIALSRLLANLVDNAVRHARDVVRVRAVTTSEQVLIEVTDDGPGIPEADRLRIFDRFTRLNDARTRADAGGGTGLGLAIARDIASAHGGTLTAEPPAPGQTGARLVLTLPAG